MPDVTLPPLGRTPPPPLLAANAVAAAAMPVLPLRPLPELAREAGRLADSRSSFTTLSTVLRLMKRCRAGGRERGGLPSAGGCERAPS